MEEKNLQKKSFAEKIKALFSPKKKESCCKEKKRVLPKLILEIFLWIIAALIATVLLVLIFIDPLLNFSVTTVGSGVTGLNITLDNIEMSLTDGTFKIVNLKVTNPEGFESETMLELGTFYISWNNNSLLTDKILIHDIEVRKLYINAEVSEEKKLNFIALAEKFAQKQSATENAEKSIEAVPPQVWIEKFSVEDFKFNWIDKRKEFSIHGFGAALEKLEGSLTEGEISIRNFKVANPQSFALNELLVIEAIDIEIDPDTLYSAQQQINNVAVSGLTACAEFNKNGDFNVLALVDSMQDIFPAEAQAEAEEDTAADSVADTEESSDNAEVRSELKSFSLSDSWFHLEDDRLKIPVKVPLVYGISNFRITGGADIDILPFLHKQAIFLRDTCSGVTNADQLALNFFTNAAESGVKLFKSAGQVLLDGAGKAGNILINSSSTIVDGGGKIIDSTHQSGKKVIKKIINIF